MSEHVQIIAEIGSNYDGDLSLAKEYIRAAKDAGADIVKFQTLRKDRLVAPRVEKDGQWVENPVWGAFSNLELPDAWHAELLRYANELGVEFMSAPFYLEAVDLLETVGVTRYKIASGDITFLPLLEKVGATRKPVVLSTGASHLEEVAQAIDVLEGAGCPEIALLHCVSNYPPTYEEMNLRVVGTLKERFGRPVGISDHSPGSLVPLATVALGGTWIEKHVTLDRANKGPDHPYAMTFAEFDDMVRQVRTLEKALGDGVKRPAETELAKRRRIRRGVYDAKTFEPVTGPEGLWLRPIHRHDDPHA